MSKTLVAGTSIANQFVLAEISFYLLQATENCIQSCSWNISNGRDSSENIGMRGRAILNWMCGQGSISSKGRIFFLHYHVQTDSVSHPASYPMGTRGPSPGLKQLEREADHLSISSDKVKNAWSFISTPPYVFVAWCLIKDRDNLTLRNIKMDIKEIGCEFGGDQWQIFLNTIMKFRVP
jgi:hypothetical protein